MMSDIMSEREQLIAKYERYLATAESAMISSAGSRTPGATAAQAAAIPEYKMILAALRQQQGEPFGYIGCDAHTLISGGEKVSCTFSPLKICDDDVPLFTSAPQQEGMVPVEPTKDMIESGANYDYNEHGPLVTRKDAIGIYKAMIAAKP